MTSNKLIMRYTPGWREEWIFAPLKTTYLITLSKEVNASFDIGLEKYTVYKIWVFWSFLLPVRMVKLKHFWLPSQNVQSEFNRAWLIDFDRFSLSVTAWITVSFMRQEGAKSLELRFVSASNHNNSGQISIVMEIQCTQLSNQVTLTFH